MIVLSSYLFFGAFAAYVLSATLFVWRITLRRRDASRHAFADRLGQYGFYGSVAGLLLHGGAMIARWAGSGVIPMSNMFEYMSFLGWSVMLFLIILSFWYKLPALGAFVAPVGVIVIAYASVFPTEVKPLVPALQSYWLPLHVSLAALGEGAFAVSFGAAFMYLLRVRKEQAEPWEEKALELFFYVTTVLVGFIILALSFKIGGYSVELANAGEGRRIITYTLPPLVGPVGSTPGDATFLGMGLPLFQAPTWMHGIDASKKLNTLVLSVLVGTALYGLGRFLFQTSFREMGSRAVAGMNPKLLDEVSYRGIAVGFPIFTLGALVFAMIWAQKAWGAYWHWDPKETWALISWLFYSGYLHMRIVRGWEGRPTAWIATIGWLLILFTLVGVNLLIAGLHSYT